MVFIHYADQLNPSRRHQQSQNNTSFGLPVVFQLPTKLKAIKHFDVFKCFKNMKEK